MSIERDTKVFISTGTTVNCPCCNRPVAVFVADLLYGDTFESTPSKMAAVPPYDAITKHSRVIMECKYSGKEFDLTEQIRRCR